VREDRGCGLPHQLLDREQSVGVVREPIRVSTDVGADEGAIGVQRRPTQGRVLLEGKLELSAPLLLGGKLREPGEAEEAHRAVEMRRTHAPAYALACAAPLAAASRIVAPLCGLRAGSRLAAPRSRLCSPSSRSPRAAADQAPCERPRASRSRRSEPSGWAPRRPPRSLGSPGRS